MLESSILTGITRFPCPHPLPMSPPSSSSLLRGLRLQEAVEWGLFLINNSEIFHPPPNFSQWDILSFSSPPPSSRTYGFSQSTNFFCPFCFPPSLWPLREETLPPQAWVPILISALVFGVILIISTSVWCWVAKNNKQIHTLRSNSASCINTFLYIRFLMVAHCPLHRFKKKIISLLLGIIF